jgi:hypothetical protein
MWTEELGSGVQKEAESAFFSMAVVKAQSEILATSWKAYAVKRRKNEQRPSLIREILQGRVSPAQQTWGLRME